MLYSIFQKLFYKIRQEAVLSIAVLLALLSACFVLPDASYFGYIDFRTLTILFSLMTVMSGLQRQGVFTRFAYSLLSRTNSITSLVFVLVGLCFFCSMLITNDVALLTFVPFSFAVLGQLPEASGKKLLTPVVCLQTIAANLGSMLTPIGNPQNLYLYGKSQLSFSAFLQLMLPYTLLSAILLSVCIFYLGHPHRQQTVSSSIQNPTTNAAQKKPTLIRLYIVLFFFCLLAVLHVLPYPAVFVLVLLGAWIADKKVLAQVDYSLLATFLAFFIFIGNLGRIPAFASWLSAALSGREILISVLASQVMSNVPAALLLSGFSNNVPALIVGTNLGGLGTLIASMASLISYRQIARKLPEQKGQYFLLFTLANIGFLAILLVFATAVHP